MSQTMGGKTPNKTNRNDTGFPYDFFAALSKGDDDGAMLCLRAEALPDGEVPSPRAEALIKTGEWDSLQKLTLVFVEADACAGRIGADGYRFCGKLRNFCKVATHTKNTIGKIARGWYVACLGKTQGVFTTPYLPALEEGGPIRAGAAARLVDGENPFRLTRGQWRFIVDSWYAGKEASRSSSNSSNSSSPVMIDPIANENDETADATSRPFDFSELANALKATTEKPSVFQFLEEQTVEQSPQRDPNYDHGSRVHELEQLVYQLMQKDQAIDKAKEEYEERIRCLEANVNERIRQFESERNVTLQSFRLLYEHIQPIEHFLNDGQEHLGVTQDFKDRLEEVTQAVFGPQGPVESLKLQFTQFKDKLESDGGITCNGVTFGSKRELLNWFDSKQPPVEIFVDALAYLHSIRSPVVYQEEATRQREAQIKTNMTNQLQVAVFTSFDTIIPAVLVGGKRMTDTGSGSIYSWLESNIKSFDDWKPKGGQTHGVSHTINNGIGRVTDSINELRSMQTDDSQTILLSIGLCTDSATFCTELVRFITDQHETLTSGSIVPEKQVWTMLLECLQKIIEELSEARGRVAAAAHFNKGYYLWGMLRAWKVQKRYLSNNFKDDPALNGILVRHLLFYGLDTGLKDKFASLDSLKNKVDEHHRQETAEIKKLKDLITDLKKKKKNNNQNNRNNNNNDNEENE